MAAWHEAWDDLDETRRELYITQAGIAATLKGAMIPLACGAEASPHVPEASHHQIVFVSV